MVPNSVVNLEFGWYYNQKTIKFELTQKYLNLKKIRAIRVLTNIKIFDVLEKMKIIISGTLFNTLFYD